jgi:hypothetical protein
MIEGNEHVALNTPFFAMRPEEQLHFSRIPYDQESCYAVMLLATPALPGDTHKSNGSHPLAVLCAAWHDTTEHGYAWGWVHLEANTKELIGYHLENNMEAEVGKWYYMLVSGGIGHRPLSHMKDS